MSDPVSRDQFRRAAIPLLKLVEVDVDDAFLMVVNVDGIEICYYLRNSLGEKYIGPDGEPAMSRRRVRVEGL